MSAKQEEKVFLKEIQGTQCQSWLRAKQAIDKLLGIKVQLDQQFKWNIMDSFNKVNNILVLLYIHSLGIQLGHSILSSYSQRFTAITSQQGCYKSVNQWWVKQQEQQQIDTVELILQSMSGFMVKEMKHTFRTRDLAFMLLFFNRLKVTRERDVTITTTFLTNLAELYLNQHYGYESKELLLTRLVCQTLQKEEGEGNLGSIMDQCFIKDVEGVIWKFCELRRYNISEIPENSLLSIFRGLCKGGVNYCILHLCLNISTVLQVQEEFYKLRHLYQQFILIQVAGRMKACTKLKVSEKALQLCELYVYGFHQHCRLDKACLQCLLCDVDAISNANYRKRWVQMAMVAATNSGEENFVASLLEKNDLKADFEQSQKELLQKKLDVWDINTRNIKKHKHYKHSISTYKGIINDYCDCYIISTIQALFMTQSLPQLLQQVKKASKTSLIAALTRLFYQLQEKKAPASVQELKFNGPADFVDSKKQEDAHQYLLYLMSMLQAQFKDQGLLKQFKCMYQIASKSTIKCQVCGYQTENTQQDYCYTISNHQKLKLQLQEELVDFKCEKCKKTKSRKFTQMTLPKSVLIVHINRFSMNDKQAKKQLATQSIPRNFQGFELVGMVFHIGKNVQSGHYVYYSKVDARTWLYFNDNSVTEFSLDAEGERFQKQMKTQHTPYILFYQRIK